MLGIMRDSLYWSNVAMAVGGALLLFLLAQRGWLAPDVSPQACFRFWRGIFHAGISQMITLSFHDLKKSLVAKWRV